MWYWSKGVFLCAFSRVCSVCPVLWSKGVFLCAFSRVCSVCQVLWSKGVFLWGPQHQRAHRDPAALNNTFHAVVTAGPQGPRDILALQRRCLRPGTYAAHLERWLQHYQPSQVSPASGHAPPAPHLGAGLPAPHLGRD